MTACAVWLLPDPELANDRDRLAGGDVEVEALHGMQHPVAGAEADVKAAEGEEGDGHRTGRARSRAKVRIRRAAPWRAAPRRSTATSAKAAASRSCQPSRAGFAPGRRGRRRGGRGMCRNSTGIGAASAAK